MRAKTRLGGALLALLVAPLTSAGTATDPDVPDPSGDVQTARGDITGIWLTSEDFGLRITARLRSVTTESQSLIVETYFRIGDAVRVPTLGVRFDGSALAQTTWSGLPNENDMLSAQFKAGTPATITAVIPWQAYAGLVPGATLTGLRAESSFYDDRDGEWVIDYDKATGRDVLVHEKGPATETLTLSAIAALPWLPTLVTSATTLAGALGGYHLWRRTSSRERS